METRNGKQTPALPPRRSSYPSGLGTRNDRRTTDVAPAITGTTALGDTMTATHVIVAEDQGTNIAVKVTATNTAGSATATSANTAVPVA